MCVRACVCACVRACVFARVCACVCVRARASCASPNHSTQPLYSTGDVTVSSVARPSLNPFPVLFITPYNVSAD